MGKHGIIVPFVTKDVLINNFVRVCIPILSVNANSAPPSSQRDRKILITKNNYPRALILGPLVLFLYYLLYNLDDLYKYYKNNNM